MNHISILERLVTEGDCCDASCESQAVFDKGVLAVVSTQVIETLNSPTIPRLKNGNTPIEEMLLDIKRSFGKRTLKGVADIGDFLQRGKEVYVALPEVPDFLVLVMPLTAIKTLFICAADEAPEEFGIIR